MLRIKIRTSGSAWLLTLFFFSLILQNPLEKIAPIIKYLDELYAMIGLGLVIYNLLSSKRMKVKTVYAKIAVALVGFALSGLLGNYLYRYQETASVATDLLVCLKFFFCIALGYECLRRLGSRAVAEVFADCARFCTVVFFVLLIIDLLFNVFPDVGTRYRLRVVKLFYEHPTYLAAVMVFLLSVLTMFHNKKNNVFILMALTLLFFTLRGKAIAATAMYGLIYFFVFHRREKIRIWHIALIGVVVLFVAWDQFSYYYIEAGNESARFALTTTSIQIMKDYFPIGTGFGTFASHESAKNYSQVYYLYDLTGIHGLTVNNPTFTSDTFWPIIIGQTGIIGTVCYVYALIKLGLQALKIRSFSIAAYSCVIFIFGYLLISSTSEAAFFNVVAIPLAILFGFILEWENTQ